MPVQTSSVSTAGDLRVDELSRLPWAVRLVLAFGLAASIAANVLHARPSLVSQVISAWPPLSLLLTVELISRIPVYRWWRTTIRVLATVTVAGIAGWVSYWHMAEVARRFGETRETPYLLPISVDELIIVASICLVELTGRIREANPAHPLMRFAATVGESGKRRCRRNGLTIPAPATGVADRLGQPK